MAGTRYFLTGALGCIGCLGRQSAGRTRRRTDCVRHRHRPTPSDRDHGRRRPERGAVRPRRCDRRRARSRLRCQTAGRGASSTWRGCRCPTCRANPPLGALVNVIGTLNVFEAARAAGITHVVYASSAAVFGITDEAVDETVTPEPLTHYGVFKQANEGNARVYYRDHGVSSVGLRPFTV